MRTYSTHPNFVALRVEPDDLPPLASNWRDPDFYARRRASPGYLPSEIAARSLLCAVTPPVFWPVWWLTGWGS